MALHRHGPGCEQPGMQGTKSEQVDGTVSYAWATPVIWHRCRHCSCRPSPFMGGPTTDARRGVLAVAVNAAASVKPSDEAPRVRRGRRASIWRSAPVRLQACTSRRFSADELVAVNFPPVRAGRIIDAVGAMVGRRGGGWRSAAQRRRFVAGRPPAGGACAGV